MRPLLVLAVVCAAAAYVIAFGLGEGQLGTPPLDVYGYFYPQILYALHRLAAGGSGLLWNPYQNCGQPFFGITETGLFYPLNAFFLILPPEVALRALLFTNLVIGGLGAYGLERAIGVSRAGAIAGALAFVLGTSAYNVTTWMPTVQAPYVWMPVAMLCCERLVQAPSLRVTLLLGIALAAGLLPGHPQFVLFTCQLAALRVLWSLLDAAERRHFVRAAGGLALAMAVMLLLTAVQFVPSLEVIGESVRHTNLTANEIAPRGGDTLDGIAQAITQRNSLAPFVLVPGFFSLVAVVSSRRRRPALFYLLVAVGFLVLSLGLSTRIGYLYYQLPLSSLFREPVRFRFVTGFCVAVLTGLAVDALVEKGWLAVGAAAAALAGIAAWTARLSTPDWGLAATLLGGATLATAAPRARPLGVALIVATIALAPVVAPLWTMRRFLADDRPLYAHAELFERLRARLTPDDRVHLAQPEQRDLGLQEKSGLIYQIRATTDYETQVSQRYAEYSTMLRRGVLLRNLNQVYFAGPWNPKAVSWPLLDLAAARYLVVDHLADGDADPARLMQLTPLDDDGALRVYENHAALPRAYYVPQIAVVPDRDTRLQRLGAGHEDRRRLALVDENPPSGFLGVPGNQATGEARFVVDEPEHVVLDIDAPERGFLFLADQFFPGWAATVNGEPAPILIGNHTFRLVEVPRGRTTVEFRYRPKRVWIGALISGMTLLLVAGVLIAPLWRGRLRTKSSGEPSI